MLTILKKAARLTTSLGTSLLLLGGLTALAAPASAGTANLVASAKTTTLPDGSVVPMWGYSCNDGLSSGVTCAAANAGAGGSWSPDRAWVDEAGLLYLANEHIVSRVHTQDMVLALDWIEKRGSSPQEIRAAELPLRYSYIMNPALAGR